MKKIINFLFLVTLSTNSAVLLASCGNKIVSLRDRMPFDEQPFTDQNSDMLKEFLNQLDFDHNELEGNELNDTMDFDQYKKIVEKQILSYITNNFNPKFKVRININKTSNTLKQDNCKVKCEISCICNVDIAKKNFDVKFKNVNTNTNLISLGEVKTKLTADLIDGSTLDQLVSIGSKTNKDKILKLITNIVDNREINVELLTLPEINLSQTDNTVKIQISHSLEKEVFNVKFKNVKVYSEKAIDDLLNDAKYKLAKPISGTDFDDQMILDDECINKIKTKIDNVIKDERIIVKVMRLNKTLQEVKNKVKFEISINHKVFKDKSKQLILELQDVLASNWHKILHDIEKKLTNNPIDCKQLVKDNLDLVYEENREQVINVIKPFICNKDVNLTIITKFKTLKDHKNTIKVKIFNNKGSLERQFNIVLCNIKISKVKELDKNKLESFESLSLKMLLGINSKGNEKTEIKNLYKNYQRLLHKDKLSTFFHLWWKKIKKLNYSSQAFDLVYSWLQKEIFYKLSDEQYAVEAIFKKLDSYNDEIVNNNEDVNQFYRYLGEISQILNNKYADIK